jgi:hypothetical protein
MLIKVSVYSPDENDIRGQLIDRRDVKRVIDHGDHRLIVFDYVRVGGGSLPSDCVKVKETLDEIQILLNGTPA